MSEVNANSSVEESLAIDQVQMTQPLTLPPGSAGAMLANARTEKNWSVQDIAEKLKLSPKQVIALEKNQYELLPKMVIVRGFVRSYAKLLKIDAEAILALLPPDQPSLPLSENLKPALSTPYIESRLSLVDRQNQNHHYVIGIVVLAALIALFLLHQKFDFVQQWHHLSGNDKSEASALAEVADGVAKPLTALEAPASSAASSANSANTGVAATPDISAAERSKEATGVDRVEASQPAVAKIQESVAASNVSSSLPKAVAQAPAPTSLPTQAAASAPSAIPVAVAQVNEKAALQLVFQQDSWLQIKSSSGNVLTSHLAKAGTQESFNVNETLQVRLGNAPGVKAVLRGVALDLMPDKGSNVANITVQ